jgi:hypothetical protein
MKNICQLACALGLVIAADVLAADKPFTLELEDRTTLRVGESAVLQIPSDRRYELPPGKATVGGTLALVRRSRRSILYRAVRAGSDVIVVGPVTRPGECVSCATLHYFITVLPRE